VTTIDEYAFSNCTSLTYNTYNTGKYLGNAGNPYLALVDTTSDSITQCTIHPNTKIIAGGAFSSCTSLTGVTIPDSVTTVGNYAFSGCDSLTDVYYGGTQAQWDAIYVADDNEELQNATLHCGVAAGTCGDNVTWTLDDAGTLTISGTGAMYDYDWDDAPWHSNRYSVKKVVIADGVTTIGAYAFYNCDSLTSVTIGNSVTTIGNDAFSYCRSLSSVTIGNRVTTIGEYAFFNCDSLSSVTIGNRVTTIGDSAFRACDSLTSVTIGNRVTTIGYQAFYGCDSLTSVTIPDSVTTIDYQAFSECTSLTGIWVDANNPNYSSDSKGVLFNKDKTTLIQAPGAIVNYTIPDSVTTIGNSAFYYCTSLTSVTIGNSVTTIGYSAFYYCTSLTSVTMGNSVTTIGYSAFSYCYDLTSVTMGNSVTTIGEYAFYYCISLTSVTMGNSVTTIGEYAFYYCISLTSVTIGNRVTTIGNAAFYYCTSLTHVWYTGSRTDRNKISIGSYNSDLTSATWHYNSCWGSATHTYDNSCDTECNVCGDTRTTTHSYDHACDTDCNVCGESRTVTHDYQWVIDLQETCGTDGVKHEECTVCHAKRSEDTVIPATNAHTYDDACDANCNVCKTERTPPHAPGAEWMHDETTHWRACTLCKQKLEQQAHIDNGEGGCTVCPWKTWIPGDLNGNEELTTDDAVYLLLSVMFGTEDYPTPDGMNLDFNADGSVDTNDAVYLLLHVMFGAEDYPLAA